MFSRLRSFAFLRERSNPNLNSFVLIFFLEYSRSCGSHFFKIRKINKNVILKGKNSSWNARFFFFLNKCLIFYDQLLNIWLALNKKRSSLSKQRGLNYVTHISSWQKGKCLASYSWYFILLTKKKKKKGSSNILILFFFFNLIF